MPGYPVTFEMDFVERRSRLTTFFRWLLVIPHLIVLTLWSIAAGLAIFVAWFAVVFTARYPLGLYDFVAGFLRYSTRVTAYACFGTDPYPPFTGGEERAYPARLNVAPPLERYSRLKAGFRLILAIPVLLILSAMQIVYQIGAFIAWFAILVLGRQPKGLQDMIALGVSYQQRAYAYFALVTEDWPPFVDHHTQLVEPGPAFGALPESGPPAAAATPGTETTPEPAEPPPPPADEPTPQTEPPPPHGDPMRDEDDEEPPTTRA
jgi:Domain of unknown function (DUF4389)